MSRVRITTIEIDGWAPGLGALVDQVLSASGGLVSTVELTSELPAALLPVTSSGSPAAPPPAADRAEPRQKPKRIQTKRTAPRQAKGTTSSPAKEDGGRKARAEEIRRRIGAGESNAVIAAAVGVTEAAVYQHRRKLGAASPKPSEKKPKGDAPRPRFRCEECGQSGYDPKRCDHCQERR